MKLGDGWMTHGCERRRRAHKQTIADVKTRHTQGAAEWCCLSNTKAKNLLSPCIDM